jgi:protein-tyrosine-phosphatase
MGKKSREKKERKKEKLVVFVCTANVCRSPMAEKLFEDALGPGIG